jgi:hypothetical protein
VARWAERVQPIKDFDPAKQTRPTQAELKLLDALEQLNSIKDSEGHKAAVEHAESIERPIRSFIIGQAKDKAIEKFIEVLISEAAAKVYGWVGGLLQPVPIADDEMLARDALRKKLIFQFNKYLDQRLRHAELTQSALR